MVIFSIYVDYRAGTLESGYGNSESGMTRAIFEKQKKLSKLYLRNALPSLRFFHLKAQKKKKCRLCSHLMPEHDARALKIVHTRLLIQVLTPEFVYPYTRV